MNPIELHFGVGVASGEDKDEVEFWDQTDQASDLMRKTAIRTIKVRKPQIVIYLHRWNPYPTFKYDQALDRHVKTYIENHENLKSIVEDQTKGAPWSIWNR